MGIRYQALSFFQADIGLGMAIVQGLGVDMNSLQQPASAKHEAVTI
jgi:hypothetical protein